MPFITLALALSIFLSPPVHCGHESGSPNRSRRRFKFADERNSRTIRKVNRRE